MSSGQEGGCCLTQDPRTGSPGPKGSRGLVSDVIALEALQATPPSEGTRRNSAGTRALGREAPTSLPKPHISAGRVVRSVWDPSLCEAISKTRLSCSANELEPLDLSVGHSKPPQTVQARGQGRAARGGGGCHGDDARLLPRGRAQVWRELGLPEPVSARAGPGRRVLRGEAALGLPALSREHLQLVSGSWPSSPRGASPCGRHCAWVILCCHGELPHSRRPRHQCACSRGWPCSRRGPRAGPPWAPDVREAQAWERQAGEKRENLGKPAPSRAFPGGGGALHHGHLTPRLRQRPPFSETCALCGSACELELECEGGRGTGGVKHRQARGAVLGRRPKKTWGKQTPGRARVWLPRGVVSSQLGSQPRPQFCTDEARV